MFLPRRGNQFLFRFYRTIITRNVLEYHQPLVCSLTGIDCAFDGDYYLAPSLFLRRLPCP